MINGSQWRGLAWLGFIFGIFTAIGFLMMPLIGLTGDYFVAAREGISPAAFTLNTDEQYIGVAIALFFVLPFPTILSTAFLNLWRQLVVPKHLYALHEWLRVMILAQLVMVIFLGVTLHYSQLMADDPVERADMLKLFFSVRWFHNLFLNIVSFMIAFIGWRFAILPKKIAGLIMVFELLLTVAELLTLMPNPPNSLTILGFVVGTIRIVAIAIFAWQVGANDTQTMVVSNI